MGECICRIWRTVLRSRRRSDAGAYCEHEERKFDVDVHAQGFEREGIKEAEPCPPFKNHPPYIVFRKRGNLYSIPGIVR